VEQPGACEPIENLPGDPAVVGEDENLEARRVGQEQLGRYGTVEAVTPRLSVWRSGSPTREAGTTPVNWFSAIERRRRRHRSMPRPNEQRSERGDSSGIRVAPTNLAMGCGWRR